MLSEIFDSSIISSRGKRLCITYIFTENVFRKPFLFFSPDTKNDLRANILTRIGTKAETVCFFNGFDRQMVRNFPFKLGAAKVFVQNDGRSVHKKIDIVNCDFDERKFRFQNLS